MTWGQIFARYPGRRPGCGFATGRRPNGPGQKSRAGRSKAAAAKGVHTEVPPRVFSAGIGFIRTDNRNCSGTLAPPLVSCSRQNSGRH